MSENLSLYFKDNNVDDKVKIKLFRGSLKPFTAFVFVSVFLQFVTVAIYPTLALPLLFVIVTLTMLGTLRYLLIGFKNQRRARWVFGCAWIGMAIVAQIGSIFSCPPDVNIDRVGVMILTIMWVLSFSFLNLSGMPSRCRMVALFVHASGLYSMPSGWTTDDHVSSAAALVGGMLLGEIIGRVWMQRTQFMIHVDEKHQSRRVDPSVKLFLAAAFTCTVLELGVGVFEPNLPGRIALEVIMWTGLCYLQGRARWFFACSWSTVMTCKMASVYALEQQWHAMHNQLAQAAICGCVLVLLLTFIYLRMTDAPWVTRWVMLWGIIAVVLCEEEAPSLALYAALSFAGANVIITMIVDIAGQDCVKHLNSLPSLIYGWLRARNEVKAEERLYFANQFEQSSSMMTTGCTVGMILDVALAFCCPELLLLVLVRLTFWLAVLALRLHTQHNVAHESKARFFGNGVVVLTLLLHVAWIVWQRTWNCSSALPKEFVLTVAFGAALFSVIAKLGYVREYHRQAINLIVLISLIVAPPLSSMGHVGTFSIFGMIFPIAELLAYTLVHQMITPCEMSKKSGANAAIDDRFRAACAFLSHEIRNQLYPQSVILEEMKEEQSKWKDSIDMMLGANGTITMILNRVLDLAKWESGEFPIDACLFPIRRLFKAIALFAKTKNAIVNDNSPVEPGLSVSADEHLLKQAVINLVSNAAKFSENKPLRVDMSFSKTGSSDGVIEVTVTDQGRGMTPDQLTKVVVPFAQIRKAGEARSGTGLGLPLTKVIVETGHKGTLTLESEGLGKGTTAKMCVPVKWQEKRVEQAAPDPLWWVMPHPGVTADLLVVDDVKMNRMMTIFAAKKLGLTFHEAADGTEALERLRKNTYSIVFMDRQMPGMNGDLATEQARADGYNLPIVMVSGDTFEECEMEEIIGRGMTAFLSKMAVPGTRHAMKKLKEMKHRA